MLYTLKNESLTVTVSDMGAELLSVRSAEGCEYIWQGDAAYWKGHAPLMFPICGRLIDGKYTWEGKTYEMNLHGFARRTAFSLDAQTESTLCLTLRSDEETRKCYPFDFVLTVEYTLTGRELCASVSVKNAGEGLLPATLGFHPGFNVPLDGGCFADWYVEFENPASPDKLLLSETCFITGRKEAFPLEDGRILRLRHDLFDNDAIFLSRTDSCATLRSDKSDRFVTFRYPDMPYLGFWHAPKTEAPYVCIEPWCGLPDFDGKSGDFATKCDMFRLLAGQTVSRGYSILFG
ncbi:MAG: aldose 1-epimerase family protein [Ruminococcaceae bacterium]|nr:aldose 1-epimerase family protein [Oscillospiraceae bacterium]